MITRIEIDGFKSFQNFALDMRPFQVFIGPNGAGKSNLFDAIQLLSHTASSETLGEAFNKGRGSAFDQFSALPDDFDHTQTMKFAVEMLVDRQIVGEAQLGSDVGSTRLRYELQIERTIDKGLPKLAVQHESLHTKISADDQWARNHIPASQRRRWLAWSESEGHGWYIEAKKPSGQLIVRDEKSTDVALSFQSPLDRSLLSFTGNILDRPTIYAVRQEMLSWQVLHFQPDKLRKPAKLYDPDRLGADGSNLPVVLNRLNNTEPFALNDVERDIAAIIPGFSTLYITPELRSNQIELTFGMQDGTQIDSSVLSDGTLRTLALATLRHDPKHYGVLCLEEPETGVHPGQLKQIARLLQSMATTFDEAEEASQTPEATMLRQVLINTHSPALLSAVPPESLWFIYMQNVQNGRTTAALPIQAPSDAQARRFFTADQVRRFLDAEPQEKAIEALGLRS